MLNHRCVHAFKVWVDIERALRSAAECFLFLDFDGTLSPIVSNPHQAELAPRAQDLLGGLQRMPGMRIAIISGRSLHDIRSRVGLDLTYAGNHGLEIGGPGIDFIEEHAAAMTGPPVRLPSFEPLASKSSQPFRRGRATIEPSPEAASS